MAFLLGSGLGYKLHLTERAISTADRSAFGVVLMLLFVLGTSIGSNDLLYGRLFELSGNSALIARGVCIMGSSAVAAVAYRLVYSRDRIFHRGNPDRVRAQGVDAS